MSSPRPQLVHRVAVATVCAALLPITVGALVTTKQYGMAFADWPTSDGRNMLLYPWLTDLVRGAFDKFFEHGHRLAGVVIGCCSIALTYVAWRYDSRRHVRWLATAVLLMVIIQGRLGGDRVLRNDPRWALFHGSFASLVFTLMATTALATSRRWNDLTSTDPTASRSTLANESSRGSDSSENEDVIADWARPFVLFAPALVLMQGIAGGFVRHLGMALFEHLGGAIVVAGAAGLSAFAATRSRSMVVARYGRLLAAALGFQLILGAGAWITRFGFATFNYVAVAQSTPQVAFRTAHAVTGMFVLAAATLVMLSVLVRERSLRRAAPFSGERPAERPSFGAPLAAGGGA